jgi:hypothetical protein
MPDLGVEMMPDILRRVSDENVAVRKRAIKILREIYLQIQESMPGAESRRPSCIALQIWMGRFEN